MDILLSSFKDFFPHDKQNDYSQFLLKLEDACINPKEMYHIIKVITTNDVTRDFIENFEYYSTKDMKRIKNELFKETRNNINKDLFLKVSPLLHILISKFLSNLKPESTIWYFIQYRHRWIKNEATRLKNIDENRNKSDFDIWLMAESSLL